MYTNFEIVVVEDKTNCCEQYCKSVKENGYNLKYFRNHNDGRNGAANMGLKLSSCILIAL
jgi:hypothetical protein